MSSSYRQRLTPPAEKRSKLSFYRLTRQADTMGGATTARSPVADVWGALKYPNGRESWIGEQLRSEVEFTFTCQALPLIKFGDRCKHADGRELEIIAVMRDDTNPREMKLALRQYQERGTAE